MGNAAIKALGTVRKTARKELEKSRHFHPQAKIEELAKYAEPIVSIGNQTGEGWFLTGEMIELIHQGARQYRLHSAIWLSAEPHCRKRRY